MPHGVLQRSMVQLTAAYLALIAVIFFTCAGLGAGFNPAKAQLGGDTISSVTNTLGGAVSSVTTTVNNTLSNLTSTTGGATTGVTNTVNQTISPVLNSTLSTNVTDTSGSVTTGNPLGLPLPELAIPVSASSAVAGVQAFGNGTLVTSVNGVSMSFYFDPQGPRGKHDAGTGGTSTDPLLTVKSDDLSGNEITGMYMELQNTNGYDISARYSPATFTVTTGRHYLIYANDYQNFVFNHWDDGSTDPTRAITPSRAMTLTAYYSTAGSATPPMPPTDLTATAVSSSGINLAWNAPSTNGGSTITGYKVERSLDGGNHWIVIIGDTGNSSTRYSDTGLQPGTTYAYRVSAINAVGASNPSDTASGTTNPPANPVIQKVQSGLVAYDPLTNETRTQQQLVQKSRYWSYDGDAPNENAPYGYSRDGAGLHIGVQAPSEGTWAGFFAESPNHNARDWDAVVSNPVRTTHAQYYENGLYVQTANGSLNYVTCSTFTNQQATVWGVINATGNLTQVTSYEVLWMDQSPNQSLSRNCNIITNGNDFLQVFLDGVKVYENDKADLQMPEPFNAYLEPETSDGQEYLVGTFTNYYVTTDERVQVTNLPGNAATVDLTNSTTVLATSQVSDGMATIPLTEFNLPLSANIEIYDSGGKLIASSPESMFGGDVYSLTSSGGSAPLPPVGLVATGSQTDVSLEWSAPSSNGGSPITGYDIYRSGSPGAETLYAQVGNNTSYHDDSVTTGQAYFYRVTAVNSVGESAASNEASASVVSSVTPPSVPLNLSASPESGKISLQWQSPSSDGGSGLLGYRIYRGTASGGEGATPIITMDNSTLTYEDAGLTNGQAYFYRVTAVNSAGESAYSNEASATPGQGVQVPSQPSGLVATAVSYSKISLTWNGPASTWGSAITGYLIERSANGGSTWATIVQDTGSNSTVYTDTGLGAGKTYTYRVSATNDIGTSPPSSPAVATTLATSPSSPTGLVASAVSSSEILLSWNAPGWNGGAEITGYKIERSADGGSTWATIVPDTGSGATSYSDTGLASGTTYTYQVFAINSGGTSTHSNVVGATTS